MIARLFPFLHDFSDYSFRDFKGDFLAALTLTPMAAPLAMAYAVIAGVAPQYGIYTCMLPVIVAALWGSSRFLAAGPTNATSLVLFSVLGTVTVAGAPLAQLPEEVRMSVIFGISLFCGLIQVCMGLMRLGEIANYISHSVMTAFGASMALLIASGQLTTVLGIAPPQTSGFFFQVANAAARLAELAVNPWCLLPAVLTIVLTLWLQNISRMFPATLAALALAGIVADIFDLAGRGVPMIAEIPDIVPPLSLPPAFDFELVRELFSPALALAILGGVQSLALGKQLAGVRNDVFDGSRELVAQGLGNMAAGFTSGLPGCGSFTRSAPLIALGARTRLAAVFSGILTLPLLYLLAPLISHVPMSALGGVLMLIAVQTLKPADIRFCLVATRTDRIVFLATFFATLTLDLTQAVLLGVILSLTLFIYKAAHPRLRRLSSSDPLLRPMPRDMPPGLAVYIIEGTLFFGAIHELERCLHSVEETPPRVLILHLSRVFWLDASGAHALEQFIERCHAHSVPVILVCGCPQVRDILRRTGLLDYLGGGFAADTLYEALDFARSLLQRISCQNDRCYFRNAPPAETSSPAPGSPDA
ncbi:SulP family inorganic anion transporter [uncultured Desulfovibrio sp.]|uniref:SulP family inorganic anion transporter n=1 Tax=uncultured Desulfovibrio sp. TaxID=167968 RepID=UPI0026247907|nr:SulP family inorganic anion transporter [uncultured Desulfovibrio sp.]